MVITPTPSYIFDLPQSLPLHLLCCTSSFLFHAHHFPSLHTNLNRAKSSTPTLSPPYPKTTSRHLRSILQTPRLAITSSPSPRHPPNCGRPAALRPRAHPPPHLRKQPRPHLPPTPPPVSRSSPAFPPMQTHYQKAISIPTLCSTRHRPRISRPCYKGPWKEQISAHCNTSTSWATT